MIVKAIFQTAKKNDIVMTKIVNELVKLGRSLKAEQARVEKLLQTKDLLISQLKGKVGKLESEKEKLTENNKHGSDSGFENMYSCTI